VPLLGTRDVIHFNDVSIVPGSAYREDREIDDRFNYKQWNMLKRALGFPSTLQLGIVVIVEKCCVREPQFTEVR